VAELIHAEGNVVSAATHWLTQALGQNLRKTYDPLEALYNRGLAHELFIAQEVQHDARAMMARLAAGLAPIDRAPFLELTMLLLWYDGSRRAISTASTLEGPVTGHLDLLEVSGTYGTWADATGPALTAYNAIKRAVRVRTGDEGWSDRPNTVESCKQDMVGPPGDTGLLRDLEDGLGNGGGEGGDDGVDLETGGDPHNVSEDAVKVPSKNGATSWSQFVTIQSGSIYEEFRKGK
jgi:hypothetical protein